MQCSGNCCLRDFSEPLISCTSAISQCADPDGFFQFYLPNLAVREVKVCHDFLKHIRNPWTGDREW